MANRRTPKPTGRRVRGYISDLVELSAPRALWTALVYHQDYREDALLAASAERVRAFAQTGCQDVPPLVLEAPGVFAFDTGEIRSTRELLGASRGGIGWRAATAWFIGAAEALERARSTSGLKNHGSLDPHRVLVDYEGRVSVIGYGLPRLDLVDFLDDATLLPPGEALRFTAPESLEGTDEDFGTDLFVLGLIAARLGSGSHIYAAETPTELLAAAAEGEARRALTALAVPDEVTTWLGPVLEPWPEERPASIGTAVATARTVLETLSGDDLATTMDRLAETASDVEVDLPRGWKLPVPPPPLDEEHRDSATRRLKRIQGEATRGLDRTRERFEPLSARDWSIDTRAQEAWSEAEHHLKAAQRAVDEAGTALERAEQAASTETLDQALAEGEDACDRARGANAEAIRAVDRAVEALDAAEAKEEEARRRIRADRAHSLVSEVEALVGRLDVLDERTPSPITTEARKSATELLLALAAYQEAPDDPAGLESLQGRVQALRTELGTLEKRADDEAAAAIRQAEEAAERARQARITAVDERIEALEKLALDWKPLVAQADALGTDATFAALHRELLTQLGEVSALKGAPDPVASRAALDPLAPQLESGAARLADRLEQIRAEQAAAEADAAHRGRVESELARLREEGAVLAREATATSRTLTLAHAHAEPVTDALDRMREALGDTQRAADALAGLELEPDDDPDTVLDAAQTHLQFARQAAEQVRTAAEAARQADQQENARLDREQAERLAAQVRLREQLAATGERVRAAAEQVRQALAEADAAAQPLMAPLAARGSVHLGPLERALDALRQHQALLLGRQTNWEQMAGPAGQIEDTEQLESLVATGEAEASFAEADLADLPDIQDAFGSMLAVAQAEQQVHEDALEDARERIRVALELADEAEALLPARTTVPAELSDEPELQALEDELLRAGEAARGSLARVRTAASQLEPGTVPETDWLDELERGARIAHQRADEAAGVHRSLVEAIEAELGRREKERKAREAAREAAQIAWSALQESAERADLSVPPLDDEAVAERVAGRLSVLTERLEAWEPLPAVDLEGDPHGARRLLEPLVQPRRLAADAIVEAHTALVEAIASTTELVAALRDATERGEAAADRAAQASAAVRELLQGLLGSWPHLVEQQQTLRERAAQADRLASTASEAAEQASDATRPADATLSAENAERAASEAEQVLAASRPLAEALAAEVERAREQAAEADERRRLELLEEARGLTSDLNALREGLDHVSQEAVTSLEDSPSAAARARWEEAEGLLDDANALLSRIDDALQGVFSASTAEEATELLGPCRTWLAEADQTLQPAREALVGTAAQARKDVAANEQLVVDLQGSRIELDGIGEEVDGLRTLLVERGASLDSDEPDPAFADALVKIDAQLGHLASARQELAEALAQAMGTADGPGRDALRKVAEQALARANAARNTSRALGRRLEERIGQLEAAETERRARAIERIQQQHQALVDQLDRLRGAAAVALEADDAADLPDAMASVERAVQAAGELLAGSEVRTQQADPSSTSRVLEHLVRQGERALERLEERGTAVRAAVEAVDAARRERADQLAAAYRAFLERAEALRAEVRARLDEATQVVREARAGVDSARPLLANSPAASARNAWDAATAAVVGCEEALERAAAELTAWPETPPPSSSESERQSAHEAALTRAEALRGHASTAIAEAGSVTGLVDTGLRSAQALAGILDAAGQVRGRYQTFETQIEERRQALEAAMADAPEAAASRSNQDARVQIEEIDQTLAEARACLEVLGEAESAEQAEALLQVAEISLDIVESVLEYTLPSVDRAVSVGRAESEARRVRRERIATARASLAELLHVDQDPSDFQERVGALSSEADTLSHHSDVVEASAALATAVQAHAAAYAALAVQVPDEAEPDALEALELEVRVLRSTLDACEATLLQELDQLQACCEAGREADRLRQEAIDAARTRYESRHQDLLSRQDYAARTLAQALEQAGAFAEEAPLEREALADAVQRIQAITAPAATEDSPDAWEGAAVAAQAAVEQSRDIDVVAPLQAFEECVAEARRQAELRRKRLTQASEALDELRAQLEAQRELTSELLATALTESADWRDEAALPLVALETSRDALDAADLPATLPDEPEAAEAAVEHATALIAQLAEQDPEELLEAVREAVREAEADARRRATALEAAQSDLDSLRERREARLAQVTDRLEQARALAVDHPLEAALPLAALEAALENVAAVPVPEQVPADPEAATALVRRTADQLDQACTDDVDELVTAVREAVEEALEQARREDEAREAANARLAIAHARLEARRTAAHDELAALDHAADWPEVAEPWLALQQAVDSLDALSLDPTPAADLPDARARADQAEALADGPPVLGPLLEAVHQGLAQARTRRADARARIEAAQVRLGARLLLFDTLPELGSLPATEPVVAAHRALAKVQADLEGTSIGAPTNGADSDALEQLAEQAESAAQHAEQRDIEGLFGELDQAVDEARAAEAAEEAQRVGTLEQARATVSNAVESVATGLAGRTEALEAAAGEPDPLGRRSEARGALESARNIQRDLEALQERLQDGIDAAEAISVAFDAELTLQGATEHLEQVDAALEALKTDARQLQQARSEAEALGRRVREQLASLANVLDDVPEPEGDAASSLRSRLDAQALDTEALRATTELALEGLQGAKDGASALDTVTRLREIETELQERFALAQRTSQDLRTANRSHAERRAAAHREALAADRQRAELAADRAGRALEDLGALLTEATERAGDHRDDDTIDDLLGALARQNEALLARVDEARSHAVAAAEADDPGEHARRAAADADHAERCVAQARQAVAQIEDRLQAIEDEADAARRQAEQAVLDERATRLPPLRTYVDRLRVRLDRYQAPGPSEDEVLQGAIERVLSALETTREAQQDAEEALQLVESAKVADIPDFLREAERTVASARTAAGTLKAAVKRLQAEAVEAEARRVALQIEEARGRAWDACQLARSLASELAQARNRLPDLPVPPPPRIREAQDQLVELERRLWRAGQRADEARERAGQAQDLQTALSAAEAAEKAVGSGNRWEREIRKTTDLLISLLGERSTPAPAPRSERMRNLRRGRLAADRQRITPAPAPDRSTVPLDSPTSPTEALLERLRRGRQRDDTSSRPLPIPDSPSDAPRRSRLEPEKARRSRIEPVALDPVSLPSATPDDYPSLGEFEDYRATTVERGPAMPLDAHRPIEPGQRRRLGPDPDSETQLEPSWLPGDDDDEATLVGPPPAEDDDPPANAAPRRDDDPDFEDMKTQAVNREMIEALLDAAAQEGRAWGEEDESTRWETGGGGSDDHR